MLTCRTAFASQLAAPRRALTDHSSEPAVLTELLITLSGEKEWKHCLLHLPAAQANTSAACSLLTATFIPQAGMHGQPRWVQTRHSQQCVRCMSGLSGVLSCTAAWHCCSRLPFLHQVTPEQAAALQHGTPRHLARRPCSRQCLQPRLSRQSSPAATSQVPRHLPQA